MKTVRNIIRFDPTVPCGEFKRMNAVNNGPIHTRHAKDQYVDNLELYRAAKIPFARNHDAAFCPKYGGNFTVDISAVFPCFDADVNDPASYDFACTDEYIAVTLEAGTETFYRLGQKIEHEIRKHHTLPPKDFRKWAQICEHIIRHYNEGWANGFRYNIRYWEIWNEADLDPDDCPNKRTWGGTAEQYFDLYEVTAKHLKACFPQLRIGGPALAHSVNDWAERFLSRVEQNRIPLDFFSWHIYCTTPEKMMEKNARVQALLNRHGLGGAENILNEWNYVRGWDKDFVYSVKQVMGLKGASFTLACMCEAQKSSIDMLMYYDARPCALNGMFAPYTLEPLKGYYPFLWFGMLYGRQEIRTESQPEHIYSLCGVDADGKTLTLLTHYDENDNAEPLSVTLEFGRPATYAVYLLDETHDGTLLCETGDLTFTLPVHTSLLVKEL